MSRTITLRDSKRFESAGLIAELSYLLTRIFGCWHREMSKPFTHERQSYRACLNCGARRNFDTAQWRMVGSFYFTNGER
jgi:hypothetical protein